jgi:transposase InsO family protein
VGNSYLKDDFAQQKILRLAIDAAAEPNFSFADGLLCYQGRIWIGANPDLQRMIISAFHDSPTGGHSGFPVTYRRLMALFKWHGMKQHIRDYVRPCYVYQQAKPKRTLPASLLQPLPVPSASWETATMDFVDGVSPSNRYNCILVVVDKMTKFAHFIPLKHPYTAATIADAFLANVCKLHGLPASIVSDRDPVFTSHLWQALFRAIGMQLKMSIANHPQTDGQTERVNQSLECFLRCFNQR